MTQKPKILKNKGVKVPKKKLPPAPQKPPNRKIWRLFPFLIVDSLNSRVKVFVCSRKNMTD